MTLEELANIEEIIAPPYHNCKPFISQAAIPYLQSMIDQPKKEMAN